MTLSEKQEQEKRVCALEKVMQEQALYISNVNNSIKNAQLYEETKFKLFSWKDSIIDIRLDENGNIAFLLSDESEERKMINLQIISGEMNIQGVTMGNRPNMTLQIGRDYVEIVDFPPNGYQGKGYGTMFVSAAVEIAKKRKLNRIIGGLSNVDAKTPEQRQKRNKFYEHRGFTVKDDEEGNGRIEMLLI